MDVAKVVVAVVVKETAGEDVVEHYCVHWVHPTPNAWFTREDDGRVMKQLNNTSYYYTHGYDVCDGHDSEHWMFPYMCHNVGATVENQMNGCLL